MAPSQPSNENGGARTRGRKRKVDVEPVPPTPADPDPATSQKRGRKKKAEIEAVSPTPADPPKSQKRNRQKTAEIEAVPPTPADPPKSQKRDRKKKAEIEAVPPTPADPPKSQKRDRKKKAETEADPPTSADPPKRQKRDRFDGMAEEDVLKRTLPDFLAENLDIVVIGINPGLVAAHEGHYYPGPGNHFWQCLHQSGFTSTQLTSNDDYKLMECGIGFTNLVERATKGSPDLNRQELREGGEILRKKLQKFKPKIAVFNGKLIYEVFAGKKEFHFGLQPECVDGTETRLWVMPSSSARCAQLPKASDKVPYYTALKKFRDSLKDGSVSALNQDEVVFPESKLKSYPRKVQPVKSETPEEDEAEDEVVVPGRKRKAAPSKTQAQKRRPKVC